MANQQFSKFLQELISENENLSHVEHYFGHR